MNITITPNVEKSIVIDVVLSDVGITCLTPAAAMEPDGTFKPAADVYVSYLVPSALAPVRPRSLS